MTDSMIRTVCISIVTSSLLILTIVLLRGLFRKKIRMRLQYALWLLVAIRLLILPIPLWESPLSVLRFLDAWNVQQNSTANELWNEAIPKTDTSADTIAAPVQPSGDYLLTPNIRWNPDVQSAQAAWTPDQIGRLLALGAAVGSGIVLLYFLFGNIRFTAYLHKKRIRYKEGGSPLPVYVVEGLPSPCLYGHAIYLAPDMAKDRNRLTHILTHEYCHYRQGDFLWSVIRCLCVTLYWWNPLVWLAAYLSRQDCELSCDEAALKLLGDQERLSYGKTLIELIPVKDRSHYCSIATTMSEGGRSMKRRIKQIAATPKTAGSLCVLLAALALVCFVSMSTTASTLPEGETQLPNDTEDARITLPGEPTCTYTMQVDEDNDYMYIPTLSLNEDEYTFSFGISPLSSYLIFGTYEVEDDILTASTSDGLYQFQFRIEDDTALIYVNGPAPTTVGAPDSPLTPELEYGSRFILTATPEEAAAHTENEGSPQTAPDTQEAYTQAIHELNQAVGLAVLTYNRSRYTAEECTGEGHIILDKKSEGSETVVYTLTMYGEYQFQDNSFIKEAGSGSIPAVMTFTYDEQEGYVLKNYEIPADGGYYIESIHELFPKELWDRCISQTEEDFADLTMQEQAYAKHYLQQIGREATIGDYGDYPHTLLTDAGVSVEVSNMMCVSAKFDEMWKYPDWIGNRELLEDGVRYVYAMSLDNEKHEIIYTKSVYDTQAVIETHIFDSLTGEKKQ